VSDPAAFQAAFLKVGENLQKLGEQDPAEILMANKELKEALNKAPTCQKIDLFNSGSSSAPTS
jgi:hypothetical protein